MELAELRRVSMVCERFQPALRNGKLQEIVVRDGVLRLAPSGELIAITTTYSPMVAEIDVPAEVEPDDPGIGVHDEPLPSAEEREPVWQGRSMLQNSNPAATSAKIGMGRMPRGVFLFARHVKHGHRRSKGGCPICKPRVVSVGRIGSMKLRAGLGEITDLATSGSRLTRLQPTYIFNEAPRSFVEESKPEPLVEPGRINATEMAARIAARRPEAEPLVADPASAKVDDELRNSVLFW